MKKILVFLILILGISSTNAIAADLLWRITHNDQDSLVLGEVKKVDNNMVDVKVEHVISGEKTDSEIRVDVNDYFVERINGLQEGDKILLSLDKEILNYSVEWGIFKVSTLDYKDLKILSPTNSDTPALEFYINSNGVYNDFSFPEEGIYVKDENGQRFEIYPNNNALHLLNNLEEKPLNNEVNKLTSQLAFILYLVVMMVIITLAFLYFKNSGRKKHLKLYKKENEKVK